MNTHDIELPPLPKASKMYDIPGYDEEELKDYARAAIEPYAKRIAQLEAARFAYASEFPPNEDGDPDVGSIHENIRKLKAKLEADRKRRGEPVGYFYPWELDRSLKAYPKGFPGSVAVYASPQPAESCASLMSDKPACGSKNGDCDSQPAEPVNHSFQDCPEVDKWNCKYCKRVNSCPVQGHQDAQPAEPVKSHLKVSYDDKGDCLYVCCDSNEPADAEEDDKGILYRRAISDGRLVGITIMNFMGQYAKWSDDVQRPAEPVHETARTAGNGAGSGMNTGSQAGAHDVIPYCACGCNSNDCRVNGCLSLRQAQSAMAPGGGGMPAEPVKVPQPHEFNTGNEKLDALLDDTFYLAKDGGMDNGIKWYESLQDFLKSIEPVKVPSDADAKHIQDFIACDGMGAVIVEGPQYSAVVRALLARYGKGTP